MTYYLFQLRKWAARAAEVDEQLLEASDRKVLDAANKARNNGVAVTGTRSRSRKAPQYLGGGDDDSDEDGAAAAASAVTAPTAAADEEVLHAAAGAGAIEAVQEAAAVLADLQNDE